MDFFKLVFLKGVAAAAVLALAGCDSPPRRPAPAHSGEPAASGIPTSGESVRKRQAAFLNRIREADPSAKTIDRALINEQGELGLILDRSVEMEKIPGLMRTMLTRMASEFPGEDLTVIAYTPSNPPRKIGTAHLNARSRDMSYTPVP